MNDWIKDITNIEKPIEHEAFSDLPKHYTLVDRRDVAVKAKRASGGEKVAYPLRLEKHIDDMINQCDGSKNSIINAVLELGFNELKRMNKTLLAE